MTSIKVWLIEDDPDWLRGLNDYLNRESDISVVWSSDSPQAVREKLLSGNAYGDVALLDIMLHGEPAGIALAEELAMTTGMRIIMLTSMEEKEYILRSFQAGAIDYQIKSQFESLPAAIRAAYLKKSPISPEAAEQMREEFRRLKIMEREFETKKLQDLITPSELQLLELIDEGLSQPQIADKLVISLRTVKNHVNHILKKLNLTGSQAAAAKAKEMGLLRAKDDKDSTT